MESTLLEVRPVSPVAPYIGGKRNLARRLTTLIESIEHDSYAEPFVGMGGIFFRRRRRPRAEAINDISGDVVTLFRILQRHYQAFLDTLKWQLSSRAEFERLMRVDPTTLTDLERAARFLYLQRTAFGGKVDGRGFGTDPANPSRFNLLKLVPMLEEVHDRLASVSIERLPYAEFIRRYDRRGALFYLDPPYWDCEADYGPDVFGREDFELLADQLAGIAGSFVMSINDTPGVRDVFRRFNLMEIETTYTFANKISGAGKKAAELVIRN